MLRKIYLSLLIAACPMMAQEYRSTISGLVADSQGAGLPRAVVTLSDNSTGARFRTDTGDTGQYSIPLVPPGRYDLAVEAPAFKRYAREGITVSTNQRIVIDVTMELGNIAETVSVTAEAP